MKRNSIYITISLFFLISCGFMKPKEVVINNQYKLTVDGILNKDNDLNDDASLQYSNRFSELYIIVIDETKNEFRKALIDNGLTAIYPNNLPGYARLLVDGMTNNKEIAVTSKSNFKNVKINGHNSKQLELEAKVEGHDIYYEIAYVEGKNHYYQILTWTLKNKKDQHIKKMKDMVASFKEI